MTEAPLPLLQRLWLSWACFFRVLFDGRYAAEVAALGRGDASPERASLPPPVAATPAVTPAPVAAPAVVPEIDVASARSEGALQLLALLQREGRLVDFLQQDVAAFKDAEVGAAARVVHEGCRRALKGHARVVSVRGENEGSAVTLPSAAPDVKLTGNLSGSAPYRGVLRHKGWRVEELKLPTVVGAVDLRVVAPAEVEL